MGAVGEQVSLGGNEEVSMRLLKKLLGAPDLHDVGNSRALAGSRLSMAEPIDISAEKTCCERASLASRAGIDT